MISGRLADVRDACVAERSRISDEIARIAAVVPTPPPVATERTPVYFVFTTTDPEAREQLPLGLGMILAHARQYEGGSLLSAYHFIPDLLFTPATVPDAAHLRYAVSSSGTVGTVCISTRMPRGCSTSSIPAMTSL